MLRLVPWLVSVVVVAVRSEDHPLALVLNVDSRRSRKRSADVLV